MQPGFMGKDIFANHGFVRRRLLTHKLQQRFFEIVTGKAPEYEHWLAYI